MCDSEDCPSVYHPRCVGLGGVDLEAIENWFCPWCETEKAEKQRRAEDDAPSCEEAVHWLLSHDFSYLFAVRSCFHQLAGFVFLQWFPLAMCF